MGGKEPHSGKEREHRAEKDRQQQDLEGQKEGVFNQAVPKIIEIAFSHQQGGPKGIEQKMGKKIGANFSKKEPIDGNFAPIEKKAIEKRDDDLCNHIAGEIGKAGRKEEKAHGIDHDGDQHRRNRSVDRATQRNNNEGAFNLQGAGNQGDSCQTVQRDCQGADQSGKGKALETLKLFCGGFPIFFGKNFHKKSSSRQKVPHRGGWFSDMQQRDAKTARQKNLFSFQGQLPVPWTRNPLLSTLSIVYFIVFILSSFLQDCKV